MIARKSRPTASAQYTELRPSDLSGYDPASIATCVGSLDAVANADTIHRHGGTLEVPSADELRFEGWSVTREPHSLFDRYYIVVDRERILRVGYGETRGDVAAALHDESLRDCGFDDVLPASLLGPGEHELTFLGESRGRFASFGGVARVRVLAKPTLLRNAAPAAQRPGRVRSVHDTFGTQRHDGRPDRGIRRRSTLCVNGWISATPSGVPADEIAILLSGHGRVYRIPAQPRPEPEAGVALGAGAVACGYQTCAPSTDFLPGIYAVAVEVSSDGERRTVVTDESVEILDQADIWLPSALPIYRAVFAGGLDSTLPSRVRRNGELVVSGWSDDPENVGAVFARIDGSVTHALTSGIETSASTVNARTGKAFGAILAIRLALGRHEIDILALDAAHSAVWRVARHAFEVVPDTLADEPTAG